MNALQKLKRDLLYAEHRVVGLEKELEAMTEGRNALSRKLNQHKSRREFNLKEELRVATGTIQILMKREPES